MLVFVITIIAIILPLNIKPKFYLIDTIDESVENVNNKNVQSFNIIARSNRRRSAKIANEFSQFARDGLQEHNMLRQTAPYNAVALTLDQQLCRDAQEYADHLSYTDISNHDPSAEGNKQGENIAWLKSTPPGEPPNVNDIVGEWFNEKETGRQCDGHYTQVVWKASTKFCMAISKKMSKTNKLYVVARYSPKGNVFGGEEQNVYPGYSRPIHFIDDNGTNLGTCTSLKF